MAGFGCARRGFAALSVAVVLCSPAVLAQSTPADIPGVISICAPVIGEEYNGDKDRWGECIAAVDGFLINVGAPSEASDSLVADLVVALTELYEDDEHCRLEHTELPQAIELAAQRTKDLTQQAQIIEISATIQDCAMFTTAAIPEPASPF